MNEKLLSIGDLSRLKGVGIQSLRYYDRIGILKPAYVNPDTGYRYYAPEQIIILDIIQLCLAFNLPLKSLENLQGDAAGELNLKEMILHGQAEAHKKLLEAQKALDLSEDLITQIERLNTPHDQNLPYTQDFPARALLMTPWDGVHGTARTYLKLIADLHEQARECGITPLASQGLYFVDPLGAQEQYVCIAVKPIDTADLDTAKAPDEHVMEVTLPAPVSPDADTSAIPCEGYCVLPAATYTCMITPEHELKDIQGVLTAAQLSPQTVLCLNTDMYDYCLTHNIHQSELQML